MIQEEDLDPDANLKVKSKIVRERTVVWLLRRVDGAALAVGGLSGLEAEARVGDPEGAGGQSVDHPGEGGDEEILHNRDLAGSVG